MIQESEDITQSVFAERWQTKVTQYLDASGEMEALEKIRSIKRENIFDEMSAQTGVLIALKDKREKNHQNAVTATDSPTTPEIRIRKVEVPEKITWRWLSDHVPYKVWMTLFGIMTAVFIAGLKLGEFEVIKKIWEAITK